MKAEKGNRCIFTLLELLIVISIIAILAAVLLPALKSAKDVAKETMCRNNIRQIGLAALNYADDYNSHIPFGNFGKNYFFSPGSNVFPDEYLKGPCRTVYTMTTPYVLPVISLCPAGKRFDDNPEQNANPNFSYGTNEALSYYATSSSYPLYKVRNPSGKFFWADTTWGAAGMWLSEQFSFRHRNSANISFVDNHIEFWKWNMVPVDKNETNGFYCDK